MNSPFNQEQAELLNRLLPTLTESQKIWLSGYLVAARSESGETAAPVAPAPAESPAVSREVTVLYGSQTGNAEGLAKQTVKTLEERGFQVTVASMNDFKPNNLKK